MQDTNYNVKSDEISIKELILAIWNERVIISVVTILAMLFMTFYTFFIVSPKFEAVSDLIMKTPGSVETRFGTYSFPSSNLNDYIQYIYSDDVIEKVIHNLDLDVSREYLKNEITFKSNEVESTNRFQVVVSYSDAELAKKVNDELVKQFKHSMRLIYKENAIQKFINDYQVQIDNLDSSIKGIENVLRETEVLKNSEKPIYTLQKGLFTDPEAAAIYADNLKLDISKISDHIIIEEYANENYFALDQKIIEYKSQLIALNEELSSKKERYSELLKEKSSFIEAIESGNEDKALNGKLDVLATNISIVSTAYIPEKAVAPNKFFNIIASLFIGIIFGTFIGLFRAYWRAN